jgi:hypothetical protein
MALHVNLLWMQADDSTMELLLKDPTLSKLVVARPAPDMAAFRREDQEKLQARLQKLGHIPAITGRWS